MTRTLLALLVALPVLAQEAAPPDPAREAEERRLLLSVALRGLAGATELVADVEVAQEEEGLPAPGGGAAGGIVVNQVSVGGAGAPRPFEGRVQAWRGADGVVVLASREELPGFALYVDGDRCVKEELYEEERYALDQLRAELAPLLDGRRLARKLLDAGLASAPDPLTGDVVYSGEVERSLVRRMGGGLAGFTTKRVLRVEAEVVVDPEGHLKRVAVTVVHNDPMREALARGLKGIQIGVGGAPVPVEEEEERDAAAEHDVETGSTTYTLHLHRAPPPSERAQAFKARVGRLEARSK